MKLEFLDDISQQGTYPNVPTDQMMRLYDFSKPEVAALRAVIQKHVIEDGKALDLLSVDFIESLNCNLILKLSDTDEGIVTDDYANFYCLLTRKSYKEMLVLMLPFEGRRTRGFAWLYDLDIPIDLLFSPSGTW